MTVSYAVLVILVLISLAGANIAHKVEALSIDGTSGARLFNATIDDCNGEELGEFFMQRNLAEQKKYITFDVANKKGPVCYALKYGSCLMKSNKQSRPCTIYNKCDRGGQGS
ncbi:hypothetical protein L484_018186 [Morus notabilis]|uniref:Uncharacterized protein n=1 Tax=Morus notabilis TaxID=981085 RepID=W9RHU4_9ROSA|nr:hypothetical protein L484_018186 [Morus notabilis]